MSLDPAPIVAAVEGALRAALAPVLARLQAIEGGQAAPPLPGPPGPPGPPGAAGLGLDGFDVTYDGERAVTIRWIQGGAPGEQAIVLPLMIYRGVWVQGRVYARGDCVTVGGSIYHCDSDTVNRPGAGGAGWTLAVKEGKDARGPR